MNLTITPKITNSYSQNTNNNRNQSFGELKAVVYDHPEDSYCVINRDKATTVFFASAEDKALARHVDTNAISAKGFAVEVVAIHRGSSKVRATLVDEAHTPVTYGRFRKPIAVNFSSLSTKKSGPFGAAKEAASDFINMIAKAGLGTPVVAARKTRGTKAGKFGRTATKLGKKFGR